MKQCAKSIVAVAILTGTAFLLSCHSNSQVINITGAGSTFLYPIMSRWIVDFQQLHPNLRINYQSIGSGGGIQQLKNRVIDFGATDTPLSDEQLKEMQPLIQIADTAGPVCITYNLPEVKEPLKLTPGFLLIPKDGGDNNKRQALKDFVQYVITTGQQSASRLDYTQLPESLIQANQRLLNGN